MLTYHQIAYKLSETACTAGEKRCEVMRTVQIYDDGDMICGLGAVQRTELPGASRETRRSLRLKTTHKTRRPRHIMRVTPAYSRPPAEEKELARV